MKTGYHFPIDTCPVCGENIPRNRMIQHFRKEHPMESEQAVLGETSRAVYDEIVSYKRSHNGCSPSFQWLREMCGLSSTSIVKYHLDRLISAKMVTMNKWQMRSIEVIGGWWLAPGENVRP